MPLIKLVAAGNLDPESLRKMLPEGEWEIRHVHSCMEAVAVCVEFMPCAVITDGVLPGGDGFSLAHMLRRADPVTIPGVVAVFLPGMGRKSALPGTAVVKKPLDAAELAAAIEKVLPENRHPMKAMEEAIARYLNTLGVPEHPGRGYLADAVFLAGEDLTLIDTLTKRLYPLVAARSGVKAEAIERAMRHAIDTAWARGSIESQYGIFKNTIDAARGKPTCGGMIAQLAHMLRREVF